MLNIVKKYIKKRNDLPEPPPEEEKEPKLTDKIEEKEPTEEAVPPSKENKDEDPEEKKKEDGPEEPKPEDAPGEPKAEQKKEEVPQDSLPKEAQPEIDEKKEADSKEKSQIQVACEDPNIYQKVEKRLRIRKLTDEEKLELFKTIRFSQLQHKELLACFTDPIFDLAKNFIMQGLSMRLNQYEQLPGEMPIGFETGPRLSYEKPDTSMEEKKETTPDPLTPEKKFQEEKKEEPDMYPNPVMAQSTAVPYYRRDFQEDLIMRSTTNAIKQPLDSSITPRPPQKVFYQPAPLSSAKRASPASFSSPKVVPPEEFLYTFDFDTCGLFYFLGSLGKTRNWQNPHTLGQVIVYASSIGYGSLEHIVGRSTVNCRTLNEPMSFIGVDLGEGRLFAPTCYTIRNRNISSHTMLNWQFEASEDKINWTILDRRVYLTNDAEINAEMEEVRAALTKSGATSTYAIDPEQLPAPGQGFRYFRIVQIGKNSSGSDNLSLSGLELYLSLIHI
eukprot:TRINITY_DN4970_c0_g1_i5.p1 TRINITY_DN4970_c0_g1~~TRINITY_DN4970_c0_g1_i5.p1  ORF type:complete len:500 (-),score=106.36 TRINITY_DN4970_c0_g1_i5:189-1688(-)